MTSLDGTMRFETHEQRVADERGFPQAHFVGAYDIRDGGLWETAGNAPRGYWPIDHRELPTEVAKLMPDDEDAVRRFAGRYGLLGQWHPPPEPLSWIWAHAANVRVCLELKARLQLRRGRSAAIRDYLESLDDSGFSFASHEGEMTMGRGWKALTSKRLWAGRGVAELRDPDPVAQAVDVLSAVLSEHLAGVRRWVQPNARGNTLRSVFHAPLLMDIVYWHLADVLTSSRVVRCAAEGCGGLFAQYDPRQKYCPPSIEDRDYHGNGQSRCAQRERKRRQRRKQRRRR